MRQFGKTPDRRGILKGLAAAGVGAWLGERVARAQGPLASGAFRIDAHHHFSAPGFIAATSARKTNQRPQLSATTRWPSSRG